jgi:peptidoglycan/xylan/chitin deacetylase (PgdA/CDA1 family)
MRLDKTGTLALSVDWLRAGIGAPTPGIPILMYHGISETIERLPGSYFGLITSSTRFRAQMQWLCDHGYDVVTLEDAAERVERGDVSGRRCAVVTFDDGLRDFHTAAWPILQEFGFSATSFLATGFIANDRQRFKGRDCLTWTDVRALRKSGAAFGSHTVSHPFLYGLDWRSIRKELSDSKSALEDRLGEPVKLFAYPYAFPQEDPRFVRNIREELVSVGYRIAVTTMIGRARAGADPLALRRLPINDGDDDRFFAAKLDGHYDWLAQVQKWNRAIRAQFRSRHAS